MVSPVAGADDVDLVGLDRHAVLDLADGHGGAAAQDLGEVTLPVRREVLDEDERHAGVGPHGGEELGGCLDPAGGGADADDRERQPRWLFGVDRLG